MRAYCTTHLPLTPAPLSQRLIEVLGQFQPQSSRSIQASIYIYNAVEQRTILSSCSVAALIGYTAAAICEMGTIGLADLIHPDDLDVVAEHYQHFTNLHWGEVITVNYRMKRVDGTWCLIRSQETPLIQTINGFPLYIVGIVQVSPQLLGFSGNAN